MASQLKRNAFSVPPSDEEKLLEEMIKEAEEGLVIDDEEQEKPEQEGGDSEKGEASDAQPSEAKESGDGGGGGGVVDPMSPGGQFERYSLLLPTMLNRKLVDDLAVEFCMSFNSKANRRKLATALFNVEKNR